jgi:hypothetical protein
MASMLFETGRFRTGHAMQSHRASPTARRYGIDMRARCRRCHPRRHCVASTISAVHRRYRHAVPSRPATSRSRTLCHARFRLSERIAPADRTLCRRGCLAAVNRRVVGSPRRNRSDEQAQCDQAARQFPKVIQVQHDENSIIGGRRVFLRETQPGAAVRRTVRRSRSSRFVCQCKTRMNADSRTSKLTPALPR